jgi:alpha-beta hydrolase superfamily lysophospholipase
MPMLLWLPPLLLALAVIVFVLAIHFGFRAPRIPERGTPADRGIEYRELRIPGPAGKRLHGWLLPREAASDSIILLHGWGGNAEMMLPLALPFWRAGLQVLLLDARNHGRSDRHGHSSLPVFAEDLQSAMDWLRRQHPRQMKRLALLGHSVGAGAVLFTASRRRDIDAVIAIAPFAHPERVMRRTLAPLRLPDWLVRLVLRYVERVIGHRFDEIAPIHTLCRIDAPVLLVHGDADRTVPLGDARDIIGHCPSPRRRLLVIPGADHDSVEFIEDHAAELIGFLHEQGFAGGEADEKAATRSL